MYHSCTVVRTAAHACVGTYYYYILRSTEFIPVSWWDFKISTILRHPWDQAIRPREVPPPCAPLADSVIGARSFAGVTGGLLCGAGVAPPRGRGKATVLVFAEFYIDFSVGAAISLSFESFSILTHVLETDFFFFFSFFSTNILILVWNFYLEISVGMVTTV